MRETGIDRLVRICSEYGIRPTKVLNYYAIFELVDEITDWDFSSICTKLGAKRNRAKPNEFYYDNHLILQHRSSCIVSYPKDLVVLLIDLFNNIKSDPSWSLSKMYEIIRDEDISLKATLIAAKKYFKSDVKTYFLYPLDIAAAVGDERKGNLLYKFLILYNIVVPVGNKKMTEVMWLHNMKTWSP